MPDYDPGRGRGPMKRIPPPRGYEERRRPFYGPGGLPSEGLDPAPKPRPWALWLALLICVCFLGLQLYPAGRFSQPGGGSSQVQDRQASRYEAEQQQQFRSENEASEIVERESDSNHQYLKRKQNNQQIHVFLSSDDKDLRPVAVVINSTLQNARHPERIVFHLVIPSSQSKIEYYKLKAFFPSASIDVFRGSFNFEKLSNLIEFRNETHTREELRSPFNFVPFYLPQLYGDIELIIYLDSDVVVKGDIEELFMRNLKGHPAAAVEDCSQRFKGYFDFDQVNAIRERESPNAWLPSMPYDEETCVFNRGVLLINASRWTELNVTGAIEWWMEQFHQSEKPLYRYGLSQPPFLLALYNNYEKLEHAWNDRGLGRDKLSILEQDYFANRYKQRPDEKPFLSLESDFAKILHFNGKYKPWRRDRVRLDSEEIVSLCGEGGQECYKLWWEYLSPEADHAFRFNSFH